MRKNKFDENKFCLYEFILKESENNEALKKTNTDIQSLLRNLNTYKKTPFLEFLINIKIVETKDINFRDINFIKKTTINYLNFLKTNVFSEKYLNFYNKMNCFFSFNKDFSVIFENKDVHDFFNLFKEIDYKDFIKEINDSFLDLIYLVTFLYNYSKLNKDIDFSDIFKEFNIIIKEYINWFDFHDFKEEESFLSIFHNFISLYKYFIDDFQIYIIKSDSSFTEKNYKEVFKNFKKVASKSEKIKVRNEYCLKNNLNKSDYYRLFV